MISSKTLGTVRGFVVAMLAIAFLTDSINAMNMDQSVMREVVEAQANNRGPTKVVGVPSNLLRFLFYSAQPLEHQSNGGLLGYKRSSSALDALTGVTLGKRSGPSDYLNLEPFYGRQYGARSMPRMYDMRWAPFDAFDVTVAPETN